MTTEMVKKTESNRKIELTSFERSQMPKLKNLFVDYAVQSLEWWWKVGEVAIEIYRKAEESGQSGQERIKAVSAELGLSNDRVLMDSVRLVERWKDFKRYKELIAACVDKATGRTLSISHVRELSRITDDKIVMEEAKKAVANNVSCIALKQRLSKYSGKKGKKRGPGRPVKVPSSLEDAIVTMETQIKQIKKIIDNVWSDSDKGILTVIKNNAEEIVNTVDEEGNPVLYDKLDELYTHLDCVLESFNKFVKDYLRQLNSLCAKLDTTSVDDEEELNEDEAKETAEEDEEVDE